MNKDDAIAALIMMGWKQLLPNLLIKPKNFTKPYSLGIVKGDMFVLMDDKTHYKFASGDELRITIEDTALLISPNIIVNLIADNR